MSDITKAHYWNRYVNASGGWRREGRPPGEDLAALRSGLGREAGTVPKLWPYYTCEVSDWHARRGQVSDEQAAEHAVLALYGLHQQGRDQPMHRPGVPLGRALRTLRQHDKFSEQAVDARVTATATATSVPAVLMRLRGLIAQLRTIGQPLDYNALFHDIERWHHPAARQRVRRTWGLDYHVWDQPRPSDETPQQAPSSTP